MASRLCSASLLLSSACKCEQFNRTPRCCHGYRMLVATLLLVVSNRVDGGMTPFPSLVPPDTSTVPHYYTTWATQGYMPGADGVDMPKVGENLTVDWIYAHQGGFQQSALDYDHVFGNESVIGSGWARDFFPLSRSELFFVLDQGYATGDTTIEPNPKHFPQFGDDSIAPAMRLTRFQQRVQQLGWRGLGLWTRVQKPSDAARYALWSKAANISYWKIDGPDGDCSCQRAAQQEYPQLVVEHGHCPVNGCPLNDPTGSLVYGNTSAENMMVELGCSDVVRSYDTVPTLSLTTTLSRLTTIIAVADRALPPGDNAALLNGDAESYVSNALGCAAGVMRSPLTGLRPVIQDAGMTSAREVDLFFMGNRQAKRRMDEVDRIVRWGRVAPAFGMRAPGGTHIVLDSETVEEQENFGVNVAAQAPLLAPGLLVDTWTFEPGDTWDRKVWGQTLRQAAPARVARGGLRLPNVTTIPHLVHGDTVATVSEQACGAGIVGGGAGTGADALQRFRLTNDSTLALLASPALCLGANQTSGSKLVVAACANRTTGADWQRFNFTIDGRLLLLRASGDQFCLQFGGSADVSASISVALCNASEPLQLFDTALFRAHGYLSLPQAPTPSPTPPPTPLCRFVAWDTTASGGVIVSNDNRTATLGRDGNELLVGDCASATGSYESSSRDSVRTFTIRIASLEGEIFVGVTDGGNVASARGAWVNSRGSFALDNKGLLGSASCHGHPQADSCTAHPDGAYSKHALGPAWRAGDNVTVVIGSDTVSFKVNGATIGAMFEGLNASDLAGAVPAVWMARAGASVEFGSSGGGGGGGGRYCVAATGLQARRPYVVATRYPNGCVAVTTLGRTLPRPVGYTVPKAAIALDTAISAGNPILPGHTGASLPKVGVFGAGFASLTLRFGAGTLAQARRVVAQDLRATEAEDVTAHVKFDVSVDEITLPGNLIDAIGTAAKSTGGADLSEPGMVLQLQLG